MRTVAIVNQKGGCGKTTTTVNLAGCLAGDGARVLVVDMDPQAHATLALGLDADALEENIYEVLSSEDGPAQFARILKGSRPSSRSWRASGRTRARRGSARLWRRSPTASTTRSSTALRTWAS
jgi:Mrp family chromosome partitioning ATPase